MREGALKAIELQLCHAVIAPKKQTKTGIVCRSLHLSLSSFFLSPLSLFCCCCFCFCFCCSLSATTPNLSLTHGLLLLAFLCSFSFPPSLSMYLSIYLFDDADDEDDGFFSSILFFLLRVFANTYYLYRVSLITS